MNHRWWNHGAETGKIKVVGLLVVAVLLFVCIMGAWPDRSTSVFMTKGDESSQKEENVESPQEDSELKRTEIDPEKPMLALTFDDGPGKYTDTLLNKLQECNARATFLVLGQNVRKYPETVKRMEELGCEIGNHTYDHKKLTTLTPEEIQAEVEQTNQALTEVLGHGASLVRPSYGAINDEVRASVAYPYLMWSVDTTDWQRKDAVSIVNYVLETVQDGDIVLFHDIHDFTVEAMMTLIPALQERGYQLVTVSEMAKLRGVTFENGQKYFHFRK